MTRSLFQLDNRVTLASFVDPALVLPPHPTPSDSPEQQLHPLQCDAPSGRPEDLNLFQLQLLGACATAPLLNRSTHTTSSSNSPLPSTTSYSDLRTPARLLSQSPMVSAYPSEESSDPSMEPEAAPHKHLAPLESPPSLSSASSGPKSPLESPLVFRDTQGAYRPSSVSPKAVPPATRDLYTPHSLRTSVDTRRDGNAPPRRGEINPIQLQPVALQETPASFRFPSSSMPYPATPAEGLAPTTAAYWPHGLGMLVPTPPHPFVGIKPPDQNQVPIASAPPSLFPIQTIVTGEGQARIVAQDALLSAATGLSQKPEDGQPSHVRFSSLPSSSARPETWPGERLENSLLGLTAQGGMVLASLLSLPSRSMPRETACPFPNCTKVFPKNRTYNLKAHLRSHINLKPYLCTRCNRTFSRKHDLQRHVRSHTGDKPYVCEPCGRTFPRSDALRRHWKSDQRCREQLPEDLKTLTATRRKDLTPREESPPGTT